MAPSETSDEELSQDEDTKSCTPFTGARPDTSSDGSSSSEENFQVPEDNSFIVEDDDAPAELPMQYSMNTHQDLAHHFKIICQLFVYLAVRPVSERHSFMEDAMKSEILYSVFFRWLTMNSHALDEEYFSVPLMVGELPVPAYRSRQTGNKNRSPAESLQAFGILLWLHPYGDPSLRNSCRNTQRSN
jgi:hypothetical protein